MNYFVPIWYEHIRLNSKDISPPYYHLLVHRRQGYGQVEEDETEGAWNMDGNYNKMCYV